jgi:hypothetical protein
MAMPNALTANQADVDVFVLGRLRRNQAVAMGMPNALTANQADVDVFVLGRLRRDQAVAMAMPNALTANQADVDVFFNGRLRRNQALQMGMPNALTANHKDVDKFVCDVNRRALVAKRGMNDAATTTQQEVNAAANVVLAGFRQDKAEVLQQHILHHLETHFKWTTADPVAWARGVALCGKEITHTEKRGAHRRTETGVYSQDAHSDFMSKLKKALKQDDTLKGKMSPHARDEAHAKFHVAYIHDHTFQHPFASAGERERFLTCLYHPLHMRLKK